MPRQLKWRSARRRASFDIIDGADVADAGRDLPIVGVIFAGITIALLVLGLFVFVVPALVFLLELVLTLLLGGLGVVGRVLFRRPWTIEGRRRGADHVFEWKVVGWRASGELLDSVAEQLRLTGTAQGGVRSPPAPASEPA